MTEAPRSYPVTAAMRELVAAGLRHSDGLTAQLAKPDWRPGRAHVEQARNSIDKLAMMLQSIIEPQCDVLAQGSGDCGEIARLRKGIQDYLDGHYPNARDGRAEDPQHKCSHGQFYWQPCEGCIDAHFTAILAGPSASSTGGGTAA